MQHDETNGIGNCDWKEGHLLLSENEPLLTSLVFDDVFGHILLSLGVYRSRFAVVVEAVLVLLVSSQWNAAGELPTLDNNVTSVDQGNESGE